MLKHLALAVSLIATGPAIALTCIQPTIPDSFAAANERPEDMVIAMGSMRRTGPDVPHGPDNGDPNMRVGYSFPAQFTGAFAGRHAFGPERTVNVTVEVQCAAAWCGSDWLGEALYFLRVDGPDQYTFESTVCPFYQFPNTTEHELQTLFGLLDP